MRILMAYPQGCAIASPWALLCRAVGAGFQLTEASRNKQCFQFRLSLFSIFLRVLAQTVEEPFFVAQKTNRERFDAPARRPEGVTPTAGLSTEVIAKVEAIFILNEMKMGTK